MEGVAPTSSTAGHSWITSSSLAGRSLSAYVNEATILLVFPLLLLISEVRYPSMTESGETTL